MNNIEYKGQLKGFPKEIVDRMLEHQVFQGNKEDITVFERDKTSNKKEGGFDWGMTRENTKFWANIIIYSEFDLFFKKYPKQTTSEYPKVMYVSDSPIDVNNIDVERVRKRVVFMKKCNKYIAWAFSETIEEAENELDTASWEYAIDIPKEEVKPQPNILDLSLRDLATKLGFKVE